MNILIVSQYFYPENFRINDLAIKLQRKGHQVSVLTGMPNYPKGKIYEGYSWWKCRKQIENDLTIYRVPLFLRRKSKGWQLAINYLSFVISACLIGSVLLRGKQFEVVFSTNYSPATVGIPGILMKRIKKAPMIFWVQDLWPQSLSATGAVTSLWALNIIGSMMTWIYQRCDLILVQSQAFIRPIVDLNGHRERIQYFPNWAEDIFISSTKEKDNELIGDELIKVVPPDGFIIMFAGNLGEAQSLETIVAAAEKTHNHPIHWVILGDGRKYDWFLGQIEAKNLGNRIHLLGSKPLKSMPRYFSEADALLVTLRPDPIFSATIPGKIQSYLACSRPLIGALNGEGSKVIKESQAGFAVPAGDAEALSSVAIKMSKLSATERYEMGKNAFNYYQNNFNSGVLIERLEDEMKKLTKSVK